MPQANLVPVRPMVSRSTQRSGVSSSTSTECSVPLTFKTIAIFRLPLRASLYERDAQCRIMDLIVGTCSLEGCYQKHRKHVAWKNEIMLAHRRVSDNMTIAHFTRCRTRAMPPQGVDDCR